MAFSDGTYDPLAATSFSGRVATKVGRSSGVRCAIADDRLMRSGVHAAEFSIQKLDREIGNESTMRLGVCVAANPGGFVRTNSGNSGSPTVKSRKVGKAEQGFEPRKTASGKKKSATGTRLGWGYEVTTGKLRHLNVEIPWKGQRGAQNSDRIKLVLDCDRGTLTL